MRRGLVVCAALLVAATLPAQAQQRRSARSARPDTARGDSAHIEYMREVFYYTGGSRDPFRTLISSSDVRPTLADLRLVSIIYDQRGGNSVAVVSETLANNETLSHRLRRGDQVGRLRVQQIRQYEVVFQIEEFGFERQQTLSLPRAGGNR